MIDGCDTALCSDFPSEGLPLFCCGADVFRPEVTFSCCQIFLFFASIIESLFAKKQYSEFELVTNRIISSVISHDCGVARLRSSLKTRQDLGTILI